jgi:hypothetical protein
VFVADGEAGGAIADVEHVAGDVGREQVQRLLAGVDLFSADVVDHLLRHRPALAAEQVERHAAGHLCANRRIAQRQLELGDVVTVEEVLLGLVLRVHRVHVPAETASAKSKTPSTPRLK